MAVLELVPGVSIGPVALGMTRAQVRGLLVEPPEEVPRVDALPFDYFVEREVQVYYTDAGLVDRILVFTPNRVKFAGVQFVGRTRPEVLAAFAANRFEPVDVVDFIFDPQAGLGVQFRRDKVWTAEVFAPRFYDELADSARQRPGMGCV